MLKIDGLYYRWLDFESFDYFIFIAQEYYRTQKGIERIIRDPLGGRERMRLLSSRPSKYLG